MKVLHINSEYATNNLYKNLLLELGKYDLNIINYASIKAFERQEANAFKSNNIDFIYSKPLKKHHRILYFNKINYLLKDLKEKINVKEIQCIHAHKLFSDGGVAYKLFKKYKIPYIVAIRNTDVNFFMKYKKHLKPYGQKILENASRVILLSPNYEQVLQKHYPKGFKKIYKKFQVIPNGMDSFWLENSLKHQVQLNEPIRLIYVGTFSKNKNIIKIIHATKELKEEYKMVLRLVGGGGNNEEKVKQVATTVDKNIEIYPWADKKALLGHYRDSDIFVMPSYRETFGLVYIEALSQGLPVVYSKGQGIDGYFKEGKVGFSVDPKDIGSIISAIKKIIVHYKKIQPTCVKACENFSWDEVAKEYKKIYKKCIT